MKEEKLIEQELDRVGGLLQTLSEQTQALKTRQTDLRRRQVELVHGVSVGTVVLYDGVEYRVAAVEINDYSDYVKYKPWVRGNIKRKDGSWGTGERNLFANWVKQDDDERRRRTAES